MKARIRNTSHLGRKETTLDFKKIIDGNRHAKYGKLAIERALVTTCHEFFFLNHHYTFDAGFWAQQ